MTLLEQMRNYAGVITEDATPQQIGRKIETELTHDTDASELNKKLDVLIGKNWIKTTKVGNAIYISVHPMNYNNSMGNIDDLVASFCTNEANKPKVKSAFRNWIAAAINKIKAENPKFTVILSDKKANNA